MPIRQFWLKSINSRLKGQNADKQLNLYFSTRFAKSDLSSKHKINIKYRAFPQLHVEFQRSTSHMGLMGHIILFASVKIMSIQGINWVIWNIEVVGEGGVMEAGENNK